MKKVVRTISGVAPLAVMLKPHPCPHGKCTYCPTQQDVPESYTARSPVVLRAIDCGYDPERQVKARLKIMGIMGHSLDKIELILMGGTFSAYPADYQESFIKGCFDGLNGVTAPTFEQAKTQNEKATHRCVGLCLETRPDYCSKDQINSFLRFGATRVEIGVQVPDDKSYQATNRGHTVQDVIDATKRLKNACLKTGYHLMIGLPGSTPDSDVANARKIFESPDFRPDQIKLYPCVVIGGTELEKQFKAGSFTPYDTETIVETLIKIKQLIPPWMRVMRVVRDIPAQYISSECKFSHLRDEVHARLSDRGLRCNCIRCREVGHMARFGRVPEKIELVRRDYEASDGKEVFLSYEDKENDILVALLRLRNGETFRSELEGAALIRELHVFGPATSLDALRASTASTWQNRGYGRLLLDEAERIAFSEWDKRKIVIISGVGVKPYFQKFGYEYDGPYMGKTF